MADLFPMAFVNPIVERLTFHLPDHVVVARNLGQSEGTDAVGVFPANWTPVPETKLIGSIEPTMQRYVVRIQNLRIDADEVVGRSMFSNTSRKIRAILYRDEVLRLALGGLSETMLGSIERVKKYDVTKQDYLSARINESMTYLCTTEMVFETETTIS